MIQKGYMTITSLIYVLRELEKAHVLMIHCKVCPFRKRVPLTIENIETYREATKCEDCNADWFIKIT